MSGTEQPATMTAVVTIVSSNFLLRPRPQRIASEQSNGSGCSAKMSMMDISTRY